jgi:hypothetical protein
MGFPDMLEKGHVSTPMDLCDTVEVPQLNGVLVSVIIAPFLSGKLINPADD